MKTLEPNVIVSSKILIDAPADTVWAVLAEDFANIHEWASGVTTSSPHGGPLTDIGYSGRICKINAPGFNDTTERILDYNKDELRITYQLVKGLPGFVKNAINDWKIIPNEETSHVHTETSMLVSGVLGTLMKRMMTKNTQRVLNQMGDELKHFVEKGKPHPRKLKALERQFNKTNSKK